MRLILMGTGPFAVPCFERLRSQGAEISVVISRPEVSSPNAKKGPPPSPVRLWAESHGLPTASPASINTEESLAWLQELKPDLLLVCDYGEILSQEVLKAPRLGGINLHGSLLPRHRGAAPVQWSILSGDLVAGVSVIHMTPGLDAGPVLTTRSTEILAGENAGELEVRLSQLGTEATCDAIEILENWQPDTPSPGTSQDKSLATKAPRLAKGDGLLNPSYPARIIDRQIRGLQPWPGVFANLLTSNGSSIRLIIQRARPLVIPNLKSILLSRGPGVSPGVVSASPGETPGPLSDKALPDGTLLFCATLKEMQSEFPELQGIELAIVLPDGLLALETVQPAGKRSMSASGFARGYAKLEWMRIEMPTGPHPLLERMVSMESRS